jgi:hypothetical protein
LFSGTGAQVAFTLDLSPKSIANTQVYINGVYQQKASYGVAGAVLTFSEAPLVGTSNIEVVTLAPVSSVNVPASFVEYTPEGTGAVVTTAQEKLRRSSSLFDFMTTAQIADVRANTLLIDCTSAVQNFFNYVTQNGLQGTVPKGQYLISSKMTISIGALGFSIEGPGCNSAEFIISSSFVGATAGLALIGAGNPVGWRVGGFTVRAQGSGGACTTGIQIGDSTVASINILGYQFSTVFDVHVSGFATLWRVVHARMIHFIDCAGWNTGFATANTVLVITQNGSFTGDLVFEKFQGVTTNATGNSCLSITSTSGPYNNANGNNSIAGIKFKTCDFYAGAQSIKIFASAVSYVADIWFVAGCQVDQQTVNAMLVESQDSGTLIEDLHVDGLYANKSTGNTLQFSSIGTGGLIRSIWIDSCVFVQPQQNAVNFFGAGCADVRVNDNSIIDCPNNGAAISFNGTTGIKASGNKVRVGLFNVTPYYLMEFLSGTTNIYADGNDSSGIARIKTINDASGDVIKIITNNPGYNPLAPAVVTVTASPFTYKNLSGSSQFITISGGTFSAVTLNAFGLPVTASMLVPVPIGGTVVVTYSSAPGINSYGM